MRKGVTFSVVERFRKASTFATTRNFILVFKVPLCDLSKQPVPGSFTLRSRRCRFTICAAVSTFMGPALKEAMAASFGSYARAR